MKEKTQQGNIVFLHMQQVHFKFSSILFLKKQILSVTIKIIHTRNPQTNASKNRVTL